MASILYKAYYSKPSAQGFLSEILNNGCMWTACQLKNHHRVGLVQPTQPLLGQGLQTPGSFHSRRMKGRKRRWGTDSMSVKLTQLRRAVELNLRPLNSGPDSLPCHLGLHFSEQDGHCWTPWGPRERSSEQSGQGACLWWQGRRAFNFICWFNVLDFIDELSILNSSSSQITSHAILSLIRMFKFHFFFYHGLKSEWSKSWLPIISDFLANVRTQEHFPVAFLSETEL